MGNCPWNTDESESRLCQLNVSRRLSLFWDKEKS